MFDDEDLSGDEAAVFSSWMEKGSKRYTVIVESTVTMNEEEAILALLVWATDELKKFEAN